ncbi:MAG: type sorting protein [Mucilaginibacter sp.]|nr:type sorting protein [Mucilaginibacter sp.]
MRTGVFMTFPNLLMRPIIINFFLLVIILTIAIKTKAQTCSGSLGDPVIYQTFGAGANPGPALSNGISNMTYTPDNCPGDGSYTIVNAANLNTNNCHTTWHTVTHDHTGDPNGYMMLVNASFDPSIFFTQNANGLCPNTTYEFSAYILNLITLAASGPDVIEPNITFSIESTSGQVLATYNTDIIPPTAQPQWNKYGVYFVTPAGVTDVIVKMTNNAAGGNGNDLILDDIAFRACGPIVQTGFGDLSSTGDQNMCEGTSANYTLTASIGTGYVSPFLQWQVNYNNSGWTNVPGKTSTTVDIPFTNAIAGTYQYRLSVGEGQNRESPTCNVSSQPLTIIVHTEPRVIAIVSIDALICSGESTRLSASGGLYYKWTPATGLDHDDVPNPIATPTQTTTYSVKVSNDGCYDDTKSVAITVNNKPTANGGGNRKMFVGQSIMLNGTVTGDEITNIYWTPTTGLDNPTSITPIANPTDSIIYTLNVVSKNCGTATSIVDVRVYKKITIPNTFSPNNDGINDYWDIDALIAFPESTTMIYNRNGQKVYQSKGYNKSWDGTYNNSPLPTGTYYYVIDLKNNTPVISGWVLIVR